MGRGGWLWRAPSSRGIHGQGRLAVARAKFEGDSWAGAVGCGARQVRGGFMGRGGWLWRAQSSRWVHGQGRLAVARAKFEVDSWAGAVGCCARLVPGGVRLKVRLRTG